jgi:hypothetical protein
MEVGNGLTSGLFFGVGWNLGHLLKTSVSRESNDAPVILREEHRGEEDD